MLQAWFNANYCADNGSDTVITKSLLDSLEVFLGACETGILEPQSEGFFWGTYSPEDTEEVREAIAAVREYMVDNPDDTVVYSGDW